MQSWQDEVKILDEYSTYRDEFIEMLAELQSMWDAHLSRINVAKHRIGLSRENTEPVF